MHAKFLKIVQDLRASYWFVPACMVLLALILSVVMQYFDNRYGAEWLRDFEWLTATRTEGARAVLTVIAGSVMGVAGVTFSITIVAVSYASANFGPRLIGNFMRDRGNQITLGTFIATFVYCLMVLRTVRNAAGADSNLSYDAYVPHLSVLMAIILALSSVAVLIYFIHHVPETINVGNISAKIGAQLKAGVSSLFEENAYPQVEARTDAATPIEWEEELKKLCHHKMKADCAGYIQALDLSRLCEVASQEELLIRVQYRPGDFVTENNIVLDIWCEGDLKTDVSESMNACFAIGDQRTSYQNILFVIDQLVEIIGRALSPGINDPFTAIACFNWLKAGMEAYMSRDAAALDPPPGARVRLYPIYFERFVSTMFDQSRQYVCADRNVALHVMMILTETAAPLPPGEARDVLIGQMTALAKASRQVMQPDEGADEVHQRYQEGLRILNLPDGLETYRCGQNWFGGRA